MIGPPKAAMIFCAGFGTRMGALTRETPKPLLRLKGQPLVDHAANLTREAGIETIVANTHYLYDQMEAHLTRIGVTPIRETPDILDTGGGLKAALPLLGPDPVATLNPDAAWRGPNPLSALASAWRQGMSALLLVVPRTRALQRQGAGDFDMTGNRLSRGGGYVYTGAQILDTRRLSEIDRPAFSLNLFWDLLDAKSGIHGLVYDGDWCDIGHPEGLKAAEALIDV
ncbi:MAG: nucleotidyltransferase family protein [Paracoccaceae bacterium]|nr:nucleotidyltransferase family protein [Paracoccaceae bacterium]